MKGIQMQIDYWSIKEEDKPLWQGYTPDMGDKEAEEAFIKKHGYKPGEQKRYDSCILVGPIFEDDKK